MIPKNPDTLRCRDFFIIETPSVSAYGDATLPLFVTAGDKKENLPSVVRLRG